MEHSPKKHIEANGSDIQVCAYGCKVTHFSSMPKKAIGPIVP